MLFGFCCCVVFMFFFFKQKTAYEMRISDWSSDVCSSDLKKAVPAVVNIFTRTRITQTRSSLFDDPFFQRFFGGNFGPRREREKIQNSLGSGVIVEDRKSVV